MTWRERLVKSHEWAALLKDFRRAMVIRALEGSDKEDAARIIEISRDLRGLSAFLLWLDNDIAQARKAGERNGRNDAKAGTASEGGGAGGGSEGDAGGG